MVTSNPVLSPLFIRVIRLLHLVSTASGTRVTIAMQACFGHMLLFGALGGFYFLLLDSWRFFIRGIAGLYWLWLFLVGLPRLRLYLLLNGRLCLFLDRRLLVAGGLARARLFILPLLSVGAALRPAGSLLLSLAVLGGVWRGQALCVRAVVCSTWERADKKMNGLGFMP